MKLSHGLALAAAGVVLLATTTYVFRDIGYIYEETFPHQRVVPQVLERDLGTTTGSGHGGGPSAALRSARDDKPENGDGSEFRIVLSAQWPTFAVACGESVWPILSETYQGNWFYYLSYVWQVPFGDSVRSLRLMAALIGVFGLLLLFVVVRREAGVATGLVAAGLLACHNVYIASSGLAYYYETMPMLFALGAYAALQRERVVFSVLLLSAAISLKATVGILVLPFGWFYWQRRHLFEARATVVLAIVAFLVPLLPFFVHELLCWTRGVPESSFFHTLASRGDTLSDWTRIPSILWHSLAWAFAFGGNLNGVTAPLFGSEEMPWLRIDLLLLFGAAVAYAAYRWRKADILPVERFALLCMAAAFVESTLLYATDTDIQAYVYVLPFFVAINATFFCRLAGRWGPPALVALVLLHAVQLVEVVIDSNSPSRLIASAEAQQQICDAVRDADAPVITTNYNHIGMLEHCTGNKVRPIHAYFPLSPGGTGEELRTRLKTGARALLDRWPDARYLFDTASSRVWEAREGSVLAGEEEDLIFLRLKAVSEEAAARGRRPHVTAEGRGVGRDTVMALLKFE